MDKYTYYSSKKHSYQVLRKVHEELKKQYKKGKDTTKAKQIEGFLHDLKVYELHEKKNFKSDSLEKEFEKIGTEEEYQRILEKLSEEKNIELFTTEKSGKENVFENSFANIKLILTREFEKDLNGNPNTEIGLRDFLAGEILASIPGADVNTGTFTLTNVSQQFSRKNINQQLLKKFFTGNKEEDLPKDGIFKFTRKDQKVDINGISMTFSPTNNIEKIFKLIIESNFSLKNYLSREQKTSIHIGSTTPFRAIFSVLSTLVSQNEALRIFYQGANSIAKDDQNSSKTAYYLNHLQFIYEYSGRGQIIIGDDKKPVPAKLVDYLILNDPTTTDIQVYSVEDLIAEILNEEDNGKFTFSKNVEFSRIMRKGRTRYYMPKKKKEES